MEEQDNKLILTDEEGKEHNFVVVDVLEIKESEYAILMPEDEYLKEEVNGEEHEAVIFRVVEEGEEQSLMVVENDEEWEMVANAWEEKASGLEE